MTQRPPLSPDLGGSSVLFLLGRFVLLYIDLNSSQLLPKREMALVGERVDGEEILWAGWIGGKIPHRHNLFSVSCKGSAQ
jgi:hypothetical protein